MDNRWRANHRIRIFNDKTRQQRFFHLPCRFNLGFVEQFYGKTDPETTTRTVKAATVPVLTLLSLDKSFWLDFKYKLKGH